MKQWKCRLVLLLPLALLAACGAAVEPPVQEAPEQPSLLEPVQDEEPEEDDEFIAPPCVVLEGDEQEAPASASEPEPAAGQSPAEQPAPEPDLLTIHLQDAQGNPVPSIQVVLEWTRGDYVSYNPCASLDGETLHTDANGDIFYRVKERDRDLGEEFTLSMQSIYDIQMTQRTGVDLPATTPATLTVLWEGEPPSSVQTTGLRIRIVDAAGNPVEGVELSGSPYTPEALEELIAGGMDTIPSVLRVVGPSDRDGIIRWDKPEYPGTYELTGKWVFHGQPADYDGPSEEYKILYDGESLSEVTLVWDH